MEPMTQESVWDYPRPPRLEDAPHRIRIIFNGVLIADAPAAKRVLETSHPPVYYLPVSAVAMDYLTPSPQKTFCEFKGIAHYYSLTVGERTVVNAAWYYPAPAQPYRDLTGYLAFYPGPMDACYVDEEKVQAQPGDFYGGWITSRIVGPFKGGAGTWGW